MQQNTPLIYTIITVIQKNIGDNMAEYKFKLIGNWMSGAETIASVSQKLSSEKAARACAIRIIQAHTIPIKAHISIKKTGIRPGSTISVGVILTDIVDGKRIYKYRSSKQQLKGNYESKLLNQDGSFKEY